MGGEADTGRESSIGGTSASDWCVERSSEALEEEEEGELDFKIKGRTNIWVKREKVKRKRAWDSE